MPPCGTACFVGTPSKQGGKPRACPAELQRETWLGLLLHHMRLGVCNPILPDCAYGKVVQRSQEVNNAVFVCICIFALKPNNNIEIYHLYFALICSLSLLYRDNFI